MNRHVFGLDIGGTKLRAALAAADGEMLDVRRTATASEEGPEVAVEMLTGMMRDLLDSGDLTFADVGSVAAGLPGPTDPEAGFLFNPPHLPRWQNVPFAKMLTEATGVPAHVRNDAQMAAFGEFRRGAGQGTRHMLYVTVSTGIGGGIVIDGKLYGGAAGTAGEVGHVVVDANGPACSCGRRGCLESLASGTAASRIAEERVAAGEASSLRAGEITGETLGAAAAAGDALATSVLNRAGEILGLGLGSLLNILAPEVMVLGGGFMQSGPPLTEPMHAAIKRQTFEPTLSHTRVEMAGLGQDPGLIGAIDWAREFLGS